MLTLILASFLTFVELNCENLFDCRHDSLKQDTEFLPMSPRKWTPWRYWQKLNNIAKEIIACGENNGEYSLPDLVALVEVENDSVLIDLTRRSLLRNAQYDYIVTHSPDERGIDVALLYSSLTIKPHAFRTIPVPTLKDMRPTRDILYVACQYSKTDTLHVFVVHAPSRYGGARKTNPYRMAVSNRLNAAIDSVRLINPQAKVIVAGDFNATITEEPITHILSNGMHNVIKVSKGNQGVLGSYKFKGQWQHIDHVFVSQALLPNVLSGRIYDAPFLLATDKAYGGVKPHRTYTGPVYSANGFSDHLPLIVNISIP